MVDYLCLNHVEDRVHTIGSGVSVTDGTHNTTKITWFIHITFTMQHLNSSWCRILSEILSKYNCPVEHINLCVPGGTKHICSLSSFRLSIHLKRKEYIKFQYTKPRIVVVEIQDTRRFI